jgi:hypothetical protein
MTMRPLLPIVFATLALPVHAGPLSDAFNEGTALGRQGNATARGLINGSTAPATAPHYTTTPPETTYFGSAGLGTAASARAAACTEAPGAPGGVKDPTCNAVAFSQTNPGRRPTYTIAPDDPLLTRGRTITADPHAIAGNLTGTYSSCVAQTVTQPDVFDTQTCHAYRTAAPLACDKSLVVQVTEQHSCVPGTWFGNFWVNTWGNGEVGRRYAGIVANAYCQPGATARLSFYAICTESPCGGSAEIEVDATTGARSPQTFTNFIGRSWFSTDFFNRVDYQGGQCTQDQCSFAFCTRYEAEEMACDEFGCTASTVNVTRACGTFTFERPRTAVTVTDVWDNQCATLEARSQ